MQTPTPEETLTTVESPGPGQQTESLLHYTTEPPTQIPTESPTQIPTGTPPVETAPRRDGDPTTTTPIVTIATNYTTEPPTQTPTESPTQTPTESPTQIPTGTPPVETTPRRDGDGDPTTTTPIVTIVTTPPIGCPDYPPPVFQGPFVGYEAISSQSTTVTWTRTDNTWSTTGNFPCGISFYMSMTCDPVEQKFYYDIGCSCCSGDPEWEFPPNGVSNTPLILPGELSKVKAMFPMGNCPKSCFNPGPNRRGGFSPGIVPNAKPVLLTINWNPDPNDSSTNGGSATFNIPNGVEFAAEGIVQ